MRYGIFIISLFVMACQRQDAKMAIQPAVKLKAVSDLLPQLQMLKLAPITIVYESYGCFHSVRKKMTVVYVGGDYLAVVDNSHQGGTKSIRKYFVDSSFINDLYNFGKYFGEKLLQSQNRRQELFDTDGQTYRLAINNGLTQVETFVGYRTELLFDLLTEAVKAKSCNSYDKEFTLFNYSSK